MNMSHPLAFRKALDGKIGQKLKSWYMFFFQAPMIPEWLMPRGDFWTLNEALGKDGKQGQEELEAYKYIFSDPRSLECPINYYRASFQLERPKLVAKRIDDTVPVLQIFGTGKGEKMLQRLLYD